MRTALMAGMLILLAVTASFTAKFPGEPQAPTREGAGTASQHHSGQSATASGSAGHREISCKTPENASMCYWTHGRLSFYEGDPSYRIWKIGTRRILGVFNGPSHFPPRIAAFDDDVSNPEMPASLDRAYEADYRRWKRSKGDTYYYPPDVFADFEVCPLEPEKRGEMQGVCIESAKNIVVRNRWY